MGIDTTHAKARILLTEFKTREFIRISSAKNLNRPNDRGGSEHRRKYRLEPVWRPGKGRAPKSIKNFKHNKGRKSSALNSKTLATLALSFSELRLALLAQYAQG
jgi:hypothetical protein